MFFFFNILIQILLRKYSSLLLEANLASATSDDSNIFHLLQSQASVQPSEQFSFDSDSHQLITANFVKKSSVTKWVTFCALEHGVEHALIFLKIRGGWRGKVIIIEGKYH